MKKRLVLAAALGAAVAGSGLAQVSSAANGGRSAAGAAAKAPRSGHLYLTKQCSAYKGLADQHCTITSSNIKGIPVGARVVYLEGAVGTSLKSDFVIVVGRGDYALGRVTLDLATGTGRITLSGGAGRFRSFHARAAVWPLGGVKFAWDGRYRVGHDDD
jgi:hypothetical protein